MTLCESIIENPDIILRRQLDAVKTEAVNAMKADGVPYERAPGAPGRAGVSEALPRFHLLDLQRLR